MIVKTGERRWALGFAVVVMVITTLPYLLGFWRQGKDWYFTGFVFGVEDGNSYIAKMLSGSEGAWLFRTPYTAFPQSGFLAFLPYIILGKLTAPPGEHEQLVVLFHLFRWAAGIACILATYDFVAIFIEDKRLRRLGTAVASIGGGLGWLSLLGLQSLWANRLPLEFYSPESFGFLDLYGLPHLALGRAFLLWGLVIFLKHFQDKSTHCRVILTCGILWLVLGLMQPVTVIIAWAILAAFLIVLTIVFYWRKKHRNQADWSTWKQGILRLVGIGLISSPIVIYTSIKFLTDPFLIQWAGQNIILSPPISDYLLAYGLMIPFLVFGLRRLIKDRPVIVYFLIGWSIIFPILAYLPYSLQRRLPEGIWVAITILATACFTGGISPSLKKLAMIFSLSFISAFILLVGGSLAVLKPSEPIFRPAAEIKAFDFLSEKVTPGQVVLAAYDTSNALPAWVPGRTLIGHGPESIHLAEIRPEVESFYQSSTSDQERLNLIQQYHINYIFDGPAEQAIGSWSPDTFASLALIYQEGNWKIYKVKGLSP
jgi:hypothetical protein